MNNKIVKLTAAAAGREVYEAPMVTVIALDVDDIIMESIGQTPFVPNVQNISNF